MDALNNWLNRAEEKIINNIQRKKMSRMKQRNRRGNCRTESKKHRKRVKKENYIKIKSQK